MGKEKMGMIDDWEGRELKKEEIRSEEKGGRRV